MLNTLWADLIDPKDPLLSLRHKHWDRFQEIGLPGPKRESFQYVTKKWDFPTLAQEGAAGTLSPIDGLQFIDGFFQPALSKTAAPLVCLPLDVALKSYGLFLQSRLNKALQDEKDPFALLNGAFQGRGAFLYVPPKCKAALQLRHHFTQDCFSTPRLHIYLGRGAELELIQNSVGTAGFCNTFLDCLLDDGSSLFFCDQAPGHFQSFRSTLKRDAQLKAVFIGKKIRTSIRSELLDENANAELLGLSRLKKGEESHIHAHVEHVAAHTRSKQHFKSVLEDDSRFSFEGKIYVKKTADKTESYQLNNNLILSDAASANAKPNLEIFASDVKASHGATFGRLDEEALFYLRSRGLGLEEAKRFLIEGFCKDILDHAR
jgi:Fe-S cluster assembly protein SufD